MDMYKRLSVFAFYILYTFSFDAASTDVFPEADRNVLYQSVLKDFSFLNSFRTKESLSSLAKLNELESKIDLMKVIAQDHPDQPKIYYAISRIYEIRDTMLKRHIVYANRDEWLAMPVAQENLQGIRDNLTEVARLLEAGVGEPINVDGSMSSVISVQLYERFQRIYLKQHPNGIVCSVDNPDDESGGCMDQPYEEVALGVLADVANEFAGYGYFDDAQRVVNDIANLSDEGKQKASELAVAYEEAKKTFDPEAVKSDLVTMLPGDTPKPLTIRAVDAIAENQRTIAEKEQAKLAVSSISASSEAQSSVSSVPSAESVSTPPAENNNLLILIGAGVALLLLIGFVVLRRRK